VCFGTAIALTHGMTNEFPGGSMKLKMMLMNFALIVFTLTSVVALAQDPRPDDYSDDFDNMPTLDDPGPSSLTTVAYVDYRESDNNSFSLKECKTTLAGNSGDCPRMLLQLRAGSALMVKKECRLPSGRLVAPQFYLKRRYYNQAGIQLLEQYSNDYRGVFLMPEHEITEEMSPYLKIRVYCDRPNDPTANDIYFTVISDEPFEMPEVPEGSKDDDNAKKDENPLGNPDTVFPPQDGEGSVDDSSDCEIPGAKDDSDPTDEDLSDPFDSSDATVSSGGSDFIDDIELESGSGGSEAVGSGAMTFAGGCSFSPALAGTSQPWLWIFMMVSLALMKIRRN
jgi:hypothetical protein